MWNFTCGLIFGFTISIGVIMMGGPAMPVGLILTIVGLIGLFNINYFTK